MALQSVWIERLNWDDAQVVLLLEPRQIFAKKRGTRRKNSNYFRVQETKFTSFRNYDVYKE